MFDDSPREKSINKRVALFQNIRNGIFDVIQKGFYFMLLVGTVKQIMSSCFSFNTVAA